MDMGLKHRENRKAVKAALRRWGWGEDEYGELTRKLSKAEARKNLLHRRQTKWEIALPKIDIEAARVEIMDRMEHLACEDMKVSMDSEIFGGSYTDLSV